MQTMVILIIKVVALAMGIVSIVLGFFPKEADNKNQITFFGIYMAMSTLL